MINVKYNSQLPNESLETYCNPYLVSRIYKLLPLKEDRLDWQQYLSNLNIELLGAEEIYLKNAHFLSLVHKLESLYLLESHNDYRRMIFECISVAKSIPTKMIGKEV
jgi:hypothetical protein